MKKHHGLSIQDVQQSNEQGKIGEHHTFIRLKTTMSAKAVPLILTNIVEMGLPSISLSVVL